MAPKTYSAEDLAQAMEEVRGKQLSLKQAASKYAIPATTLSGRMRGAQSKHEVNIQNQRLTPAEETRLATWCLRQDACGYAPSFARVTTLAELLLTKRGDMKPLGKHWIKGFKRRNPEIRTLRAREQEALRFTAFTPKAVN